MRLVNQRGRALIKSFESLRLKAYLDTGGVPTIGWGHTRGVKMGDVCTEAQAEEFFEQDLWPAEESVSNRVKVPLGDNRFSALVSFSFNEGDPRFAKSTLLRLLNQGQYAAVPLELAKWIYDNGVVQNGLIRRRAAETALWRLADD